MCEFATIIGFSCFGALSTWDNFVLAILTVDMNCEIAASINR
jgi:hypothetical protein